MSPTMKDMLQTCMKEVNERRAQDYMATLLAMDEIRKNAAEVRADLSTTRANLSTLVTIVVKLSRRVAELPEPDAVDSPQDAYRVIQRILDGDSPVSTLDSFSVDSIVRMLTATPTPREELTPLPIDAAFEGASTATDASSVAGPSASSVRESIDDAGEANGASSATKADDDKDDGAVPPVTPQNKLQKRSAE